MNERDRIQDEKLTRLLQSAGPASIPSLEPDPHLPARIRALARESEAKRSPAREGTPIRPRWAWLSLGTAALALSVMLGGYIGYRAGITAVASNTSSVTTESTSDDDALWDAWSQSGFADQLNTGDGEVKE